VTRCAPMPPHARSYRRPRRQGPDDAPRAESPTRGRTRCRRVRRARLTIGVGSALNSEDVDPACRGLRPRPRGLCRARCRDRRSHLPPHDGGPRGLGTFCAAKNGARHKATYPSRKSEYGPTLAGFLDLGLKAPGRSPSPSRGRARQVQGEPGAPFAASISCYTGHVHGRATFAQIA